MAEWNSPYKTFDKSYIISELQCFHELYEKVSYIQLTKLFHTQIKCSQPTINSHSMVIEIRIFLGISLS